MSKNSNAERHFLFKILKPYRNTVLFVLITSLLGSAFDGISIGMLFPLLNNLQGVLGTEQWPRVFQLFLPLLHSASPQQQVFIIVGIVLFTVLLKNLFLSISVKAGHWLTSRVTSDLRVQATSLLLEVQIGFHHQSKTGDLLDKSLNTTTHIESLVRFCMELMANSATFLALVGVMLVLSWPLTIVVFALGGAVSWLMSRFMKALAQSGGERATGNRELLGLVHECLSGIQLIKSYSHEANYTHLLEEKIETVRQLEYRHNFKGFLVHPLVDMAGTLGIGALVAMAMAFNRADSRVLLAQLLPFLYVMLRLVPLAKILSSQRVEIAGRWCHLGLMRDFLRRDDKPFIADGQSDFGGLHQEIEFRFVTFAYQSGREPVLREANFTLPAGKTTAIVGESGAGKSTLLQLLLRLYEPQEGEILLDGEPLKGFRLKSLHHKIGVVSQDTFLFNSSIRDNIALGLENLADELIVEAAIKAGAHDFIAAMPHGYSTLIGDRGVKLSGGQRQRIAIARALLREPEILIFDEATNALDRANESWIHKEISKFGRGKTVIIVTHRPSATSNADHILRVANGQVHEVTTTELTR
ncbi:heterocyst differentiation ATP-binding protein HepA [Abditibacteriota bacterium]|nr:heterocyst differentiation ATP-binding protein HepA [Abditibacteriota bacterium]